MIPMTVRIDAAPLRAAYRGRAERFPAAIKHGLRRIMVAVQGGADAKLSGAGAAWSYPVPRRLGALARGMYGVVGDDFAEIGNTARHAWSVHTGRNRNWRSPPAVARPFIDDTVRGVDHLGILQAEVRGAW